MIHEHLLDFAGYKVSDTMRKGILDINVYKDAELELMLGCISALAASATWLMVATFFKLPISGTHSIVGATVGYSLVQRGAEGVQWKTLAKIGKISRTIRDIFKHKMPQLLNI